jgi:hypothetical protein
MVRQQKLAQTTQQLANKEEQETTNETAVEVAKNNKIWKVYTDSNDPMGLGHPEAGLSKERFVLTDNPDEADIIYSYRSLFAPGTLKELLDRRPEIFMNQFPYEGAIVQKDHLGREILKQHGLPRPNWALETYDLDVQLAEFVGAHLLAIQRNSDENENSQPPRWIVKPAGGTQSKGHVVTQSSAHISRLIDAGGGSRVAQRYIVSTHRFGCLVKRVFIGPDELILGWERETDRRAPFLCFQDNPVCYDGRKVDCRCIVMMTSAYPPGKPTLFMHKRVYFRIAGKKHSVEKPSDMMNEESVLTAMHLLAVDDSNELIKLPLDYKTIAKLEEAYKPDGFDWQSILLPRIQTMIRELFSGTTQAYPAMGQNQRSRGLYGVDIMFEIEGNNIEPKLTEVTFCPSNNAICDAYEKDELLYREYNTDIFNCLFLGKCSDSIIQLQ